MKIIVLLSTVVVAGTLVATSAYADDQSVLVRYEGAIGSQPFRSANGAAVPNAVAGVNPGGAPWELLGLKVQIRTDGSVRGRGTGLLLGGTDNVGTRGGPRQVIASLFCRNAPVAPAIIGTVQTTSYNSQPADVDGNGDFVLSGTLMNASNAPPPLDCGNAVDNRPVLLIRSVTPANPTTGAPAAPGAWFAAGIVRGSQDRKDD